MNPTTGIDGCCARAASGHATAAALPSMNMNCRLLVLIAMRPPREAVPCNAETTTMFVVDMDFAMCPSRRDALQAEIYNPAGLGSAFALGMAVKSVRVAVSSV